MAGFAVAAEGTGEDDRFESEEGERTFCSCDWVMEEVALEGEAVPLLNEGTEEKDITAVGITLVNCTLLLLLLLKLLISFSFNSICGKSLYHHQVPVGQY